MLLGLVSVNDVVDGLSRDELRRLAPDGNEDLGPIRSSFATHSASVDGVEADRESSVSSTAV